jgi:acetylornithine deacetylase/succinyl-diaminopimelate desuccinylase-like protein
MRAPLSEGALRAIALLLALLVGSPAGAIWPFRSSPEIPDPASDLAGAAAAILSHAIQTKTVNPPGNEEELAQLYARILREHDVPAEIIETPSNGRGDRAAAWARLPGTGQARPIVLLSHLDVVPADPKGWLVDPFEGVVAGGYVVGRGALDAKGVSVVHLLTLLELARKPRLARDVIFLATPDEETGGRLGAGYLASERPDLLHDAEFLLTEGGGILDGKGGSPDVWGVTVTEKSPCWIRVTGFGEPGHSSAASGDGAIPRLVRALERIRMMETEVRVVPEVETMFEARSGLAPPAERFFWRNLGFALDSEPGFRTRFLAVPAYNALVRDTVTITVLDAGTRTNVVPAEASAHLDARLLPGESCRGFVGQLQQLVDDRNIDFKVLLAFGTRSSPVDTSLFHSIERVAAEIDPSALVVPQVIAGFTDAHYFRDLGVVAYGFAPRWLPPHETSGIHGPNERISVENLERGVHTLVRILETLSAETEH